MIINLPSAREKNKDDNQDNLITPSAFTEFAINVPTGGKLASFSFGSREYLRTIYDSPAKRILLVAGRQVEKCLRTSSLVSQANGKLVLAGEIKVGDQLVTMTRDDIDVGIGEVTWVSNKCIKPCIRVKTRQGHEAEIALTHPMRLWGSWVEGVDLHPGDRLAAVRVAGVFTGVTKVPNERIRLTAYLIGDGCMHNQLSFTSLPGEKLEEFKADLDRLEVGHRTYSKTGTRALQVKVHNGVVRTWLEQDCLYGQKSGTKFIPDWVFDLSKEGTSLFINRLWATDGHVKQNGGSKYSVEYCSISKLLVRQVQALLWKFGIPSKIRENWPNIYKKRGEKKLAYILRVETQEGISLFLQAIGALGKSERVPPPMTATNNNRDTYPKDVNALIGEILASRGLDDWHENRDNTSLYAGNLRRTLKYAPTKSKIREYVEFFSADTRFNQELVAELREQLSSLLYWDEIVKITDIGLQECVDFEVGNTHNFVTDGLVAHNSTLLGNQILSYSCVIPFFRSLYVSSSHQQAKVFSRDRIKEPIEVSPILKGMTSQRLLSNVLEKKFVNNSQITMRFAFLNADRVRGIPADKVLIDEFQDILLENIPVIEECASHSAYQLFCYSGTPKSLDGSLEHYWTRMSTQNEWAVPCKHHGTAHNSASWYWNVLDEDNISKGGLICSKCGKLISAADPDCKWASMNPNPKAVHVFEGYRIPQLMVPWIKWADILHKQRHYPRPKFYNEVLGRSFDSGTRPLTKQDIMDNCWSELSMDRYLEIAEKYSGNTPIIMGLDWGSGENSYTVVTLGGYLPIAPDRYTVFYAHRFEGIESEPTYQIEKIRELVDKFKVAYIGVDYGGGFWPNDELIRYYGTEKVKKYQWVGNVKVKIKFEPRLGIPRFLAHRTEVMSDFFNAIKRRNVFVFPRWEEFEDPYGLDFMNIFSEYNDRLRMNVYRHAPGCPDDTAHSVIFGFLASFHYRPRPDIITPTREIDRDPYAEDENTEDLDIK